ncbi:TPA: phosphoribosyl-ATP pyrophosphatase, partial [Listeria monocytogenes]
QAELQNREGKLSTTRDRKEINDL